MLVASLPGELIAALVLDVLDERLAVARGADAHPLALTLAQAALDREDVRTFFCVPRNATTHLLNSRTTQLSVFVQLTISHCRR